MIEILLCCGSGASSGFLAMNAQKYAKANNLDYHIFARSESEVEDYIDSVSLVMVGPHYKHRYQVINGIASEYNVPVVMIDEKIYSSIDGETLVKQIQSILKEK